MDWNFLLQFVIFGICYEAALGATCTEGPDKYGSNYNYYSDSPYEVLLCTDSKCTKNQKYLSDGMIISRCATKDKTSTKALVGKEFILGTALKSQTKSYTATLLCSNAAGEFRFEFCSTSYSDVTFVKYDTTDMFRIYLITCDPFGRNATVELAYANKPRTQFDRFDYSESNAITNVIYPTNEVRCRVQCGGTVTLAVDKATALNCGVTKNACNALPGTTEQTASVSCTSGGSVRKLNVKVISAISAKLGSDDSGSRLEQFDAGENIRCQGYENVNQSRTINEINIMVFTKDNGINELINGTAGSYLIPHNAPENAFFRCYLGLIENKTIPALYYEIGNEGPVVYGSRFLTYISYYRQNTPIEAENNELYVESDRQINCLRSKYSASLIQFILFTSDTEGIRPLSSQTSYKNYVEDAPKTNDKVGTLVDKKKKRYILCSFNGVRSTPIKIISGDQPRLNWVNLNPPWDTKYYIRGFVIACRARSVDSASLFCMDCPPGINFDTVISGEYRILHIDKRISKNIIVTYKCVGRSQTYESRDILIKLHLIATEYKGVDPGRKLWVMGEDYVTCLATFTVSFPISKRVQIPLITRFGHEDNMVLNTSDMGVYINETYGRTRLYYYCCPKYNINPDNFDNNSFTCDQSRIKLGQINIASNYRLHYTVPLNDLYPGMTLKCYICVNYTHQTQNQKCTHSNLIPSLIRVHVVKPNGEVNDSGFKSEADLPVEELKPDGKSYYNINQYKVSIACQSKSSNPPLVKVTMKSCNENPPDVKIDPPDKSMFVVGEIFSCTTLSLYCSHGLQYSIYVQRHGEPAQKINKASFEFKIENIGNNIDIKCTAGDSESKADVRTVRVEARPYNVSILPSTPIMVYGDYFRCQADGFPPPQIRWRQNMGSSQLRVSENFVLIGPWDDSGRYSLTCFAENKRGKSEAETLFEIYNPRIIQMDFSVAFYIVVPLFTLLYLALMIECVLVVFQEIFFGVPFFSTTVHEASGRSGVSKAAPSKFQGGEVPEIESQIQELNEEPIEQVEEER